MKVTPAATFLLLLLLLPLLTASSRSKWSTVRDLPHCQHTFTTSKRETGRQNQQDPLLLWIGRPSRALQVEGKYGPLPMPSVWASFVNVLYVSHCDDWKKWENAVQFLDAWFDRHEDMKKREVYVAGNMADEEGGKYVLNIVHLLTSRGRCNLVGIIVANPHVTPVMSFAGMRSFETKNDMTFWTIDRARQNIICNGLYSEVEFLMHDVHLRYQPTSSVASGQYSQHSNFEYELLSISTPEKCYRDVDKFSEAESSDGTYDEASIIAPKLSGSPIPELFPSCDGETIPDRDDHGDDGDDFARLIERGIKIVFYSYLQRSSQAICNFYIGIYTSDASYFSYPDSTNISSTVQKAMHRYNHATLEEMGSAWSSSSSASSGSTVAWIQNGLDQQGGMAWIQIDDRFVTDARGSVHVAPSFGYLTKSVAVEILSHVLRTDSSHNESFGNVIDFVDLLV